MAYTWLNQLGGYNLASTSYSVDNLPPNPYSDTITVGNTPVDRDVNSEWFINTNVKIAHSKTSAVWLFYIDDEENNVNLVKVSGINASYIITFTFLIAIDYENQKAYAIPIVNYSNQWEVYDWEFTEADKVRFYQLIKDDIPSLYNWQSVPSISGKNGILSLSQAKASALNNGEPVSSASASDFDSLTAQVSTLVTDDSQMAGKEAGGISGSGDNSADQSTGNAFGQGESGTNVSGGGSGLYGGYKGTSSKSGGAGSGYIGNSLLSNKKMVGYNVPTSSAEGTKTESINEVSASAVSGKPKSGNGFARIKFLRNNDWRCLESIEVDGVDCPLLQINDFSIIPNTYGGTETLIRRQSGIYTPSGVSDLGSEFAQPTISSGTVEKSTNYNNVIFRTTFGYNAQAYSNFNQNEIIYNTNTVLMTHGFLLATEANTRLYIGIALNDVERYGCCYFVAQYPDRNWTTENYSGGDGEIGYLIYSIFSNS